MKSRGFSLAVIRYGRVSVDAMTQRTSHHEPAIASDLPFIRTIYRVGALPLGKGGSYDFGSLLIYSVFIRVIRGCFLSF